MSKPAHLEPSKLGTKEYWDSLYTTELTNHAHDPSDTGTVWFDDSDAEAKLIEFLSGESESASEFLPLPDRTSFLDLGTGNGSLLFGLRDAGWVGPMLGVDYSRQSIELARGIGEARRLSQNQTSSETPEKETEAEVETENPVRFLEHDLLQPPPSSSSSSSTATATKETETRTGPETTTTKHSLLTGAQSDGWDVVLDKGTFDAISLSSEREAAGAGRRVSEGYRGRVLPLVREGGLFLVTSCNWTEGELRGWFEGVRGGDGDGRDDDDDDDDGGWGFEMVGRVEYPSFSFGGVKGQTISSICFRKVKTGS